MDQLLAPILLLMNRCIKSNEKCCIVPISQVLFVGSEQYNWSRKCCHGSFFFFFHL